MAALRLEPRRVVIAFYDRLVRHSSIDGLRNLVALLVLGCSEFIVDVILMVESVPHATTAKQAAEGFRPTAFGHVERSSVCVRNQVSRTAQFRGFLGRL